MHYLHLHSRDNSGPEVFLDMISNRTTGPGKLLLELAVKTKVNEIGHEFFSLFFPLYYIYNNPFILFFLNSVCSLPYTVS
jgi:hypothetical protein